MQNHVKNHCYLINYAAFLVLFFWQNHVNNKRYGHLTKLHFKGHVKSR